MPRLREAGVRHVRGGGGRARQGVSAVHDESEALAGRDRVDVAVAGVSGVAGKCRRLHKFGCERARGPAQSAAAGPRGRGGEVDWPLLLAAPRGGGGVCAPLGGCWRYGSSAGAGRQSLPRGCGRFVNERTQRQERKSGQRRLFLGAEASLAA